MSSLASPKSLAPLLAIGLAIAPRPAFSATESVIYTFLGRNKGAEPTAPLTKVGPNFYGTTSQGGTGGSGTVFSLKADGERKVLYSFPDNSYNLSTVGGLTEAGGILYGTTSAGGINCPYTGCGTVFAITPQGVQSTVYAFQGGSSDGAMPDSVLLNIGGTFYGSTRLGGAGCECGTVFSVSRSGVEKIIYSFQGGADGSLPGDLTTDGKMLYGTTEYGGRVGAGGCKRSGCGTVFSMTLQGVKKTIYTFPTYVRGSQPLGALLKRGNRLYGVTLGGGGAMGLGTVYSLTTSGTHRILHAFTGSDGLDPSTGLINVGGVLYGTVPVGNDSGAGIYGAVYSVTHRGVFSTIYAFKGIPDGNEPAASLFESAGTLYGTTAFGGSTSAHCGTYGCGTIFSIQP